MRTVICAFGATFRQICSNGTKEEEMNRNENCFLTMTRKQRFHPRLLVFTSFLLFLPLWDADVAVEANPWD